MNKKSVNVTKKSPKQHEKDSSVVKILDPSHILKQGGNHEQEDVRMTGPVMNRLVRLDEESLYELDRRLTIEVSKLTPGEYREVSGTKKEKKLQVPEKTELDETKSEIIENYRLGVKIASQTESHPLIPLFEAANIEIPPILKVDHEQMQYNFYLVEVIFSSFLPRDQFLLSAELELNLTDDVSEPARRTRPICLFPGRKDIQFFNIDVEGAVGIDAGMNFSVPIVGHKVLPFAEVGGDAHLKAAFVAEPFHFQFRKAAIEVKGESDQNIFWRYNLQSELCGTNDFKSILVLKIAEEASSVQMSGSLAVVPCKRRWILFKDVLPPFSAPKEMIPVELVPRRE